MKERLYIGVDPGKSGAWAVVKESLGVLKTGSYDELPELVEFIKVREGLFDFIGMLEKVHAMPGQGVVSMFTFGETFGVWKGLFIARNIPYHLITPQRWQKAVLDYLPAGREAVKAATVDFVKRTLPATDKILALKKNWGRADAICLALFGIKEKM